jgi:hypothetical protein
MGLLLSCSSTLFTPISDSFDSGPGNKDFLLFNSTRRRYVSINSYELDESAGPSPRSRHGRAVAQKFLRSHTILFCEAKVFFHPLSLSSASKARGRLPPPPVSPTMIMTFRAPVLAVAACIFLALDGRVVMAQVRMNYVERNRLVVVLSHCGLSHFTH